jgi:hypothetical protein
MAAKDGLAERIRIYTGGKQFWLHPDSCPILVRFREAVRVQKAFSKLSNEVSVDASDDAKSVAD